LGVDGIDALANPDTDAELVKAVHDAGMIYAVWTIDNPYQADHFIRLGVDAVTSNRAARLKTRAERISGK
jgi:glycerophosphoryl diester phosphodiesterase